MPKISLSPLKRARALVVLDRGISKQGTVLHLQKKYHPKLTISEVEKAYFPHKGAYSLGNLENSTREQKIEKLKVMRKAALTSGKSMKSLFENPKFAQAVSERASKRMTQLHQDPDFSKRRDARSKALMERLNKDPKFKRKLSQSSREVMTRLQQNPEFGARHVQRLHERFNSPETRRLYVERMDAGRKKPEVMRRIKESSRKRMQQNWANPEFRRAHAERLSQQHKDPKFAVARDKRASETLRKLYQDPKFVEANKERARQKIAKLRKNPKFVEKHRETARKTLTVLNQDPAFRKAASGRLLKLREDPEFLKKMLRGLAKHWKEYYAKIQKKTRAVGITIEAIESELPLGKSKGSSKSKGAFEDFKGSPVRIAISTRNPASNVILQEREAAITQALDSLTSVEREIVSLSFGFDGDALKDNHIAIVLKKSKTEISQIFQTALLKLSKNKKLQSLK